MSAKEREIRSRKEPTAAHFKAMWLVCVKDYSYSKAGKIVGLSQSTVYRWLKRFKLTHGRKKKYPKTLRFSPKITDKVTKQF